MNSPERDALTSRLDSLERRLARIEAALNLPGQPAPVAPAAQPPAAQAAPAVPSPEPIDLDLADAQPVTPTASQPPPTATLDHLVARRAAAQARLDADPAQTPAAAAPPPSTPLHANLPPQSQPAPPVPLAPPTEQPVNIAAPLPALPRPLARPPHVALRSEIEWERLLGGKWFAVAGGLVVIIGVIFFFQFAYQKGWLQAIPPALKCAAGAVFGAALLGAAEFLRRRINAWAAVGVNAAGLGAIYVSAFAAFHLYELVPSSVALAMLAGCAALGVFIGVRSSLVAVAIVSILGAYLAPIILGRSPGGEVILPPYWLMLQAVGLLLSAFRGPPFTSLRTLTGFGTLLCGALWVYAFRREHPDLSFAFLGLAWAAVHAELWWSSRRDDLAIADASATARPIHKQPISFSAIGANGLATRGPVPALSSFSFTTWAAGLAVVASRSTTSIPEWVPTAVGCLATLLAGRLLAGNFAALKQPARNAREALGAVLLCQAGALLIATVSLMFDGGSQVVAWLALGAAAVLGAGSWICSNPLHAYGCLVLSIATFRLLLLDSWSAELTGNGIRWLGLVLTKWAALTAFAGLSWIVSACLLVRKPEPGAGVLATETRLVASRIAAILGVLILLASLVHSQAQGFSVLVAWSVLSAVVALSRDIERRLYFDAIGLLAIGITMFAWVCILPIGRIEHLLDRGGWSRFPDPLFLHRGLLLALALAVEAGALSRWFRRRAQVEGALSAPVVVAIADSAGTLLVLVASSLEVARVAQSLTDDVTVRGAAVSVWWGLFAIGLLVFGFFRNRNHVRIAGLALLGLGTLKAVVFDLANVSLGWRALSVLAMGLLMLGVGVAYARLSRAARSTGPPPE